MICQPINVNLTGYCGVTILLGLVLIMAWPASAQRKHSARQTPERKKQAATELAKLRDDYINATAKYKASLTKLLTFYEDNLRKAEAKLATSKALFQEGLLSKRDLAESELAVTSASVKVEEARKEMSDADEQVARVLIELETEKEAARVAKGQTIATNAFIRYNGSGVWALSEATRVNSFYTQKFGRPLPIAVLGQGAIHNLWRLDHRNAMDVSVHPDSAEGRTLMEYLRSKGIPFSAFRQAIPGTATGPHIHIGKPSHRY